MRRAHRRGAARAHAPGHPAAEARPAAVSVRRDQPDRLARAYLALGDPAGARAVLAQAGEILRPAPGLGVLHAQVAQLRGQVPRCRFGRGGASTLTAAEASAC